MGVLIAVLFGVIIALLLRAGLRERKRQKILDDEFLLGLEESRLAYRQLDLVEDVGKHSSPLKYKQLRGERFLKAYTGARNFDTKVSGDLFVTTKAIVFQNDRVSDRITWSSVTSFELKRDGIDIQRRRGSRKAFQCNDPDFLALAEAAYLASNR